MQETQGKLSAVILETADQRLARFVLDFGVHDLALDLHMVALAQIADCRDARLVDIGTPSRFGVVLFAKVMLKAPSVCYTH